MNYSYKVVAGSCGLACAGDWYKRRKACASPLLITYSYMQQLMQRYNLYIYNMQPCKYIYKYHCKWLLPCAHMYGRVMCSVASVCILYACQQKTGCLLHKNFLAALMLETFLLSVICCLLFQFKCLQCGFLSPVSCTDKAIHAFSNKTQRPLVMKYFLLSFNCMPHPLGY